MLGITPEAKMIGMEQAVRDTPALRIW